MDYPGMPLDDKRKANPYTLIDSPSANKAADPEFPQIIKEAYQVIECTWNDSFDLHDKIDGQGDAYESHYNLVIDDLLVKERYVPGIEKGEIFPNMPIFCGFRANRGFWFAEHDAPFTVALPTVEGTELQSVSYMANRIDPNVHFTDEACKRLTGIPRPFMQDAFKGIVAQAIAEGVTEIGPEFLKKIGAERS